MTDGRLYGRYDMSRDYLPFETFLCPFPSVAWELGTIIFAIVNYRTEQHDVPIAKAWQHDLMRRAARMGVQEGFNTPFVVAPSRQDSCREPMFSSTAIPSEADIVYCNHAAVNLLR